MGAKPSLSRRELSTKLRKSCEVRVLGPRIAKLTVPLTLLPTTGSSLNDLLAHFRFTCHFSVGASVGMHVCQTPLVCGPECRVDAPHALTLAHCAHLRVPR